jgi:hypothetical protein
VPRIDEGGVLMRALKRFLLTAGAAVLCASTSSCFAVTDLDRFKQGAGATGNFSDLKFTVRGMNSHVNEMFEYRIIDKDNTLQSRGIIQPLGATEATLFAPGAIPKANGPFKLDFYADHDPTHNMHYDRDQVAGTGDHSWRIELGGGDKPPAPDLYDDNTGTYVVMFDHNTSFNLLTDPFPPREIGSPATIRLSNMGAFMGKRLEIRIADASSKRVVAFYRVPSLAATDPTITIPGMIDAGVTYTVEVYTDDNAPTPGAVRAFRVEQPSGPTGLDVSFDPAKAPEVHDAAPP